MSIKNYSILVGGSIAVTGGTATPVLVKRSDLNNVQMILDDDSAFAEETRISVTTTEPKQNASSPGGYTQRRVTQKAIFPFVNSDGSRTTSAIEISCNFPVEATPTEIAAIRNFGTQILMSTDADDLYDHGSVV